jgi:chromosome segregation ATPase
MPVRKKTSTPLETIDTPKVRPTTSVTESETKASSFVEKITERRKSIESHLQELLDQVIRQATAVDEMERKVLENAKELEVKRTREQQEQDFTRELDEKKSKASLQEELYEMRTECERECAEKRAKVDQESQEVTAQKDEFAKMKKQIESFPKETAQAIADTEKSTRESLTRDFEVQKKLLLVESENKIKLLEQEITAMRGQLTSKDDLIASLTSERNAAISKIQELATEAMKRPPQQVIREVQVHTDKT